MSWNCLKCETVNADSNASCEVCSLERLFSKTEVDKLIREKPEDTDQDVPKTSIIGFFGVLLTGVVVGFGGSGTLGFFIGMLAHTFLFNELHLQFLEVLAFVVIGFFGVIFAFKITGKIVTRKRANMLVFKSIGAISLFLLISSIVYFTF